MTRDLRSVLDEFADGEGHALAVAAPDPRTEALRVRARVRRRRAVRVTGAVTGAAAAAVVVGVLAAQGLTAPVPVVPAVPSTTTAPAPAPTPSRTSAPAPTPSTSAPETPPASPAAPAVTWPVPVGEEEVMHGGPGPWTAVWLEATDGYATLPPVDGPEARELEALGYGAPGTPLRCVEGSTEALGLDPATDWWGRVLYFASVEDAETFVRSWDRPVAGVVADADLACDWG
jgi:hypothetical protein